MVTKHPNYRVGIIVRNERINPTEIICMINLIRNWNAVNAGAAQLRWPALPSVLAFLTSESQKTKQPCRLASRLLHHCAWLETSLSLADLKCLQASCLLSIRTDDGCRRNGKNPIQISFHSPFYLFSELKQGSIATIIKSLRWACCVILITENEQINYKNAQTHGSLLILDSWRVF